MMTTNDLYIAINSKISEISTLQNDYIRQVRQDASLELKTETRLKIKSLQAEVTREISRLITMDPFDNGPLNLEIKENIAASKPVLNLTDRSFN